jgi:phosphatidylinositol alpha-1,6-mannosyltransferase
MRALRVVLLLTDAFGGFGGIAKFNRDFILALDACPIVERVFALPRLIPEPIEGTVPEKVAYDHQAACGKVAFIRRVLAQALQGGAVDLVICAHLHLLPEAWLLSRIRRARLALILHGIDAWTPSRHSMANRLAPRIDAFITVSRFSARRFTGWSKVPIDRGFILPNCVDLDRFKPAPQDNTLMARYGLQPGNVLLTVGRLVGKDRHKGFDEVIELMPQLLKRYPMMKYLIVGDGSDRARLEGKARRFGVSGQVVFAGRVSEAEKVAHYNLADVYVMPSGGEGFGIVYIEAAACGLPVIGGAGDGSPDALLDGRLGQLVDPGNPRQLMKAVVAALEGGMRGVRNPLIEMFSDGAFTKRVNEWCQREMTDHKMAREG